MKRIITILLLALFSITASTQQAFYPNTLIDETFGVENPNETKIADIDSDGDLDIFVRPSSNNSYLVWIPNEDGNGNYGIRNIIASTIGTSSFDVGDIDGDGHVDIVRGKSATEQIEWNSNDGNGNFNTTTSVDLDFDNPATVILSDIDGDGDLDIFARSRSNNSIFGWFENQDGLGNFGAFVEIGTDASGSTTLVVLKAFDIDGDTDIDLLVANEASDSVYWYENLDSAGSFGEANVIDSSLWSINSVSISDIDGDTDPDILLSLSSQTSSDHAIVVYKNVDGNGNFGPQTIVNEQVDDAQYVHSNDIDNDGDQDVIVANTDDNRYMWLANDGIGNFGNPIIFEDYVYRPSHISTADIDNNGTIDIVGTSYREDTISVFKNTDGQGTLDGPIHINSINLGSALNVIADMDNDGLNDIITTSNQDHKVSWHRSLDGLGTFGQQNVLDGNAFTVDKLQVLDFDKDGDLDIIYGYDEVVRWLENLDGNGTFSRSQSLYQSPSDIGSILFMDVDNDLDIDLITKTSFSSHLRWHTNNNGVLEDDIDISSSFPISRIYKYDLNADGFMDIVGSGTVFDKLIWFPNLGNGTFGAYQEIGSSQEDIGGVGIKAVDIDGDGDLDIVSGSANEETVLWYENLDGLGNFGDANQVASNILMNWAIAVFDSDLDGDADIIVYDQESDFVFFIENLDGNGNFGEPQELFSTNDVTLSEMVFGDLNGDFMQELLTSSYLDDKILWYENLGVLSNVVTGNVSLDLDSNGCDSSDLDIENLLITTSSDTYQFSTVTDVNGNYSIGVTEGTYNTQINSSLPNYYASSPEIHTSEFVGIENTDVKDFCLVATEDIDELSIILFPITPARPGFEAEYDLVYSNNGTTALSGSIELNFDDVRLNYLNSDFTPASTSNDQITFDYENLLPFETRVINITFQVEAPPIVGLGAVLIFTGNISPIADDITPEDNSFEFEQTVIGSYDPNDIRVLEGPEVLINDSDKYLHYIIRFQNSGTASAVNVLVTNVLHPNLDRNSLQLLNTSHDVEVNIVNGSDIQFVFNNIDLPDETSDPEGSNGYIEYKIKPISTVDVGDQVLNEAKIFFDFNPFILTNTAITTFVESLSVDEVDQSNPSIFPVPVKSELYLNSVLHYNEATIYDILGNEVIRKGISQDSITLNLETLSAGLYLLVLKDNEGNLNVKKIIKQ